MLSPLDNDNEGDLRSPSSLGSSSSEATIECGDMRSALASVSAERKQRCAHMVCGNLCLSSPVTRKHASLSELCERGSVCTACQPDRLIPNPTSLTSENLCK